MILQEKLDRKTGQQIYLYKQGVFWVAYEWKIFQGQKQITIQSGEIPQDGRVTLTMPEAYKDHIAYFNDFVVNIGKNLKNRVIQRSWFV